jgi:hypothetical protein
MNDIKELFTQNVSTKTRGLMSIVAKLAIEEDRIDEFVSIFEQEHTRNRDVVEAFLGKENYELFLIIRNQNKSNFLRKTNTK